MSDTSDQIRIDAQKSKSVTADGVTVSGRTLRDQIAVDRYLRDVAAAEAGDHGVIFRQVVPPGGLNGRHSRPVRPTVCSY